MFEWLTWTFNLLKIKFELLGYSMSFYDIFVVGVIIYIVSRIIFGIFSEG